MISYKQTVKHVPTNSFHYVFEKYGDLVKVLDKFLIPPIGGNWEFCLIDARYQDVKKLQETVIADFVNITLYLQVEVLTALGIATEKTKPWDIYLEYVSTYPKPIDNKVLKTIYYGMNRDIDNIFSVLDGLAEDDTVSKIDMSVIQNFLSYESTIYPSDVVCSLLCYKRDFAEFKRFNKRHPMNFINQLIGVLGESYAYYAVRKYVDKLFQNKLSYLNTGESKADFTQKKLIDCIDIHELTYLYILMHSSQSTNLYITLEILERREKDVSVFYKTLLANQMRNIYC